MKKKFNVTGLCYPHQHYMMDVTQKRAQALAMVEEGDYFIINRPRQYGKTTMLYLLGVSLEEMEGYLPLEMSFQGIDSKAHQSDAAFARMFLNELNRIFKYNNQQAYSFLAQRQGDQLDMDTLSNIITELVHLLNEKLVLIVDEVDASSHYDPFLSFLGMLRTKYLARHPQHATFHSVVLAGVHDIKSLKYKIRKNDNRELNSPWNIAADYKVKMSFDVEEIEVMLKEYCELEQVEMTIPIIAERLYYYTTGYPFLVSKLCKIIAEDILPNKSEKTWSIEDVEIAVQEILRKDNTNFESLIKNIENNDTLYNLVYRVLIEGEKVPFNPHEVLIGVGRMYGIFKMNGHLKIHNKIYEQILYNYLTAKTIISLPKGNNYSEHFLLENRALDMPAILRKFQQFMKEQYSKKQIQFLEEQGRLIFLSFFTPILNGQGYAFREVQISLEKRLDIVVTYLQFRYIIELKKWYGPKAHQAGLDQLADYLDIHGVSKGYLVIFDARKKKDWNEQAIRHKGKDIFMVWV